MAPGQLSPDQAQFVALLSQSTGLDPTVVTSWVGAESGWGVTKANHNYLNVGPGRTYGSVQQAATDASSLISGSGNYTGIRNAVPVGPAAQVQAIGSSPWGTNPVVLSGVYNELASGTATPSAQPAGIVTNAANAVAGAVVTQALRGALSLVFVAGGVGLVALGLERLTGKTPREHYQQVSGLVGQVQGARGLVEAIPVA